MPLALAGAPLLGGLSDSSGLFPLLSQFVPHSLSNSGPGFMLW